MSTQEKANAVETEPKTDEELNAETLRVAGPEEEREPPVTGDGLPPREPGTAEVQPVPNFEVGNYYMVMLTVCACGKTILMTEPAALAAGMECKQLDIQCANCKARSVVKSAALSSALVRAKTIIKPEDLNRQQRRALERAQAKHDAAVKKQFAQH